MKSKKIICAWIDELPLPEYIDRGYRMMQKSIENILGEKVIFKPKINPWALSNYPCDIYCIDYGDLDDGREIASISRMLAKAIEDMPNTLFILWSFCTESHFKIVLQETKDLQMPNLIYRGFKGHKEEFKEEALRWFDKKNL